MYVSNLKLHAQMGINSYPQLENCWQKITVEKNGQNSPYYLLKNNKGKAEFKITHSGNPTSFRYFQIWQKYIGSNTGKILDWNSLTDSGYEWKYFNVGFPGDTAKKYPVIINGPVASTDWKHAIFHLIWITLMSFG